MARSSLPPGFRFHPTDEELLVHYLKKKVAGRRVYDGVIGEIEIYRFEPPELPGLAALQSNDQEWFFFNAQDKKYLHGARTNRTTRAGYWKATGKDRKISAGLCTGMKKTLIYYLGRAPHGERTDWLMHEYRLDEECEKIINPTKPFVLCRIRRKGGLGPRNGEQYGAPVLEAIEENEGGASTSYQLEDTNVLPPAESRFVEEQDLDMPHVAIDEGVATTGRVGIVDDIDSFLQDLIDYEELEQQKRVQDEVLSVDDLLDFVEDLSDLAPPQEGPVNSMDLGFEDIDSFFNLLHTATDNESAILEEMLHLASGQAEAPDGFSGSRALLEFSSQQAVEAEDGEGFIELADLEEPCEEQGTIERSDIEGLFYDLDNGLERTRSAEERLEMQIFGDRQSSRTLQLDEESGMVNEPLALEVPLDSSQGLSILDSIYTRFLTSDDGGGCSDDLPSGFDLISGCKGDFPNNSHSSDEAEVPLERQPARVDDLPGGILNTQGGVHSVASVSHEELEAAHGEHVSINRNTSQQPNSTVGLPNRVTSSVGSFASSSSSSSPLARVISEVLGKINVLPASAEGMSSELGGRKPLLMDSSKFSEVGSKVSKSALNHHSISTISSASLHFRVKLIDLEHSARTPQMELHLLVSHDVSKQASTKPWRSLTNALTTTLVAILFWMLGGFFCRSVQSAF